MAIDLIGRTTLAGALKNSLDVSSQRVRNIADRVARASVRPAGFTLPGSAAPSAGAAADDGPVDIETEMANLADEQLRYEATAKFLEKTYAGLRASLREK